MAVFAAGCGAGRGGSGGVFQGDPLAECLQAGDEAGGFALGVGAAVEVVCAEVVVSQAGVQDVPVRL